MAFLLGDLCVLTGKGGFLLPAAFLVADMFIIRSIQLNKYKLNILRAALLFFALFGFLRAKVDHDSMRYAQEYAADRDYMVCRGVIESKEIKNDKLVYYLANVKTSDNKEMHKVIMYPKADTANIRDVIATKGEIIPLRNAENEGGFNEKAYYYSKYVSAKLSADEICIIKRTKNILPEALFRLRRSMCRVFDEKLPDKESGLLSMMTVGDKSLSDDRSRELFQKAGLAHIFAISGFHIMAVGGFVSKLLEWAGCSRTKAYTLSCAVVILYTVLTGASVSAIRACVMFIIMAVAGVSGEAYDMPGAMAIAALCILVTEPLAVLQASFVFSFAAVSGIAFYAGRFSDAYESVRRIRWEQTHMKGRGRRWRKRPGERLLSCVIWLISLQVFTVPVVAWYYFEIPVYVLILNVLLIPFAGILLGLGLLGGLVGVAFSAPAGYILLPCRFILSFYEWLADMSLRMPGALFVTGKPEAGRIVIYYIIILFVLNRLTVWIERVETEHENRIMHRRIPLKAKRMGILAGLCWSMALCVLCFRPIRQFEIVMLSVGQGDGIFIDSGMGKSFFIDGGSTSKDELAKYTLLPFLKSRGVGCVDVWMITHTDMDHVSGFMELLESGYKVKELFLAKSIDKGGAYDDIIRLCKDKHVAVRYIKTGDRLVTGERLFGKRRLVISCLYPAYPSLFSGANENSLVMELKYSDGTDAGVFTAVFTGDIGSDQEEALMDRGCIPKDDITGINLLKAAHHGSNHSNCVRWLKNLNPGLCIISAGKNNRYGHPGREAVERMDGLGIPHLCTIECGQISVRWIKGCMRVWRFADRE